VNDISSPLSGVRRTLSLVAVGLIGGLFSGAFGVGGGIIMVPLLLWLVRLDQRHAAATSLVAIVPTAIVGSLGYLLHGSADLLVALLIAAGGIVGSLIGTRLLRALPLAWLRWLFIALLLGVAIRLFFDVPVRGGGLELTWPTAAGLVILGLVMGVASGLFGIGGGVLVVPALVALFGTDDLLAKGVSLLAMIPTAITGSAANIRAGLVRPGDGLLVGVSAVAASFPGVALAFLMPASVSTALFGVLVLVAVAQLTVRAIRAHRRSSRAAEGRVARP
jgi:hypothetical protein